MTLVSVPDSLKIISLDYNVTANQLLDSLEAKLDNDVCDEFVSFGLRLQNQDVVQIRYEKRCQDNIISCFGRYFEVNALLNQDGLLLMGHEIITIDSIKHWMRTNFTDKGNITYAKVLFGWDEKTPKDSIEKVITTIKDGYQMVYEDLSQAVFSKNVCDLEASQVKRLHKLIPFTISFDLVRTHHLPPPPTSEIETL